jgi:hypothetical protein
MKKLLKIFEKIENFLYENFYPNLIKHTKKK